MWISYKSLCGSSKGRRRFSILSPVWEEKKLIKKLDKKEIEAIIDRSTISHNVEQYYIDREKIVVSGWAFSNAKAGKMKIQVFDNAETEKKVVLQILNRTDLIEAGFVQKENCRCGFHLEFPYEREKRYKCVCQME